MPSFLKLRKNWGHFHRAHHLSAMAGHQVASLSRILSLPRGTSLEGENLTSVMDPGLAQTIPHGIRDSRPETLLKSMYSYLFPIDVDSRIFKVRYISATIKKNRPFNRDLHSDRWHHSQPTGPLGVFLPFLSSIQSSELDIAPGSSVILALGDILEATAPKIVNYGNYLIYSNIIYPSIDLSILSVVDLSPLSFLLFLMP